MKKHILALMLLLCFSGIALSATDEVQLVEVAAEVTADSKDCRSYVIRVKNIAYAKRVTIFGESAPGAWGDLAEAAYSRPAEDGYEIWTANSCDTGAGTQFVVRYEVVNLNVYWDNNNGQNYSAAKNSGVQITKNDVNVILFRGWIHEDRGSGQYQLIGEVDLRNIAPTKDVTVVYTKNNWQTWQQEKADFCALCISANPGVNAERWGFQINLAPIGGDAHGQGQYAIAYTVNNVTYWDNNYGRNYSYQYGSQ